MKVERRCPYCFFVSYVRKTLDSHIERVHTNNVIEDGGPDAYTNRVENLSRAGVRIIDESRIDANLKISGCPRAFRPVAKIYVKNCMAEALVFFGNETEPNMNRHHSTKEYFKRL